jgi:hypothetical protein
LRNSYHYSNKPPYAERHVRWCERTVREIIPYFLLDLYDKRYARCEAMEAVCNITNDL